LDYRRQKVIVSFSLMFSRPLIYFSIIIKLLTLATLLMVKAILFYEGHIQSINISDLILLSYLFKVLT